MEVNDITRVIIKEAIETHKELGPGLLESVYEIVLTKRLRVRGLVVQRQVIVPIVYLGEYFPEGFRMDMLVEQCVVVELKSIERIPAVDFKRVQTYLRLSRDQVALLINFGEARLKDGLHRIVNNYTGPDLS